MEEEDGKLEGQLRVIWNNGTSSRYFEVCRDIFGDREATVVCKELGYDKGEAGDSSDEGKLNLIMLGYLSL